MKIKIKKNKFNLNLDSLITIGKRSNNSKRNFLFISKLLGKHLIVKPDICKATGIVLASLKYDDIDNSNLIRYINGENINIKKDLNYETINDNSNVFVIGFCETATGLGMSVASAIKNCTYQTTTREPIVEVTNLLEFKEEHSHATTHKMFSLNNTGFNNYDELILVDDEVTTGKTNLNLIDEIRKISNIKKFNIMTILDWRSDENIQMYKDYEEKFNIKINFYSLISGNIISNDDTVYIDKTEPSKLNEKINVKKLNILKRKETKTEYGKENYCLETGRFGTNQKDIKELENKCKKIADSIITNKKTLVLGHGENIYIPSRVASYLNADFKSTTRSPIFCDGNIIKSKYKFIDRGVTYYFYNKEQIEKDYEEVILLTETPIDIKLCNNIQIVNI